MDEFICQPQTYNKLSVFWLSIGLHTSGTIRKQQMNTLIKIFTQNTQRKNIKYDATPEPKWPVFFLKKKETKFITMYSFQS